MKRWQDDRSHHLRELRRHRDSSCSSQATPGRFRKRKARDCGHAQCPMCHSDKFPRRIPTRREKITARDIEND